MLGRIGFMPKFDFRYNNREAIDAERAKTLLSERLTWAANTSAEGKSGLMLQSRQRILHDRPGGFYGHRPSKRSLLLRSKP
jgi:hypothetical protein